MDILELIKSRRSIRKYRPEPVSEKELDKILEAGRWAPSAGNRQPWKFIVLRSAEVREALAEAIPTGRFISSAPLGIVVTINPKASSHPIEDGAAATQNMLLEAHSLGLGACWIGRASGTANEERAKRILNIPEDENILSIIAIGHPAESPEKSRRSREETTFTDSYGTH
jgi:nitroreductase